MPRLEPDVDAYMNEQDERSNQQREPPQKAKKSFIGLKEVVPINLWRFQAASNVHQTTKVANQTMKATDQFAKAFYITSLIFKFFM